jgi:hypothetical protein
VSGSAEAKQDGPIPPRDRTPLGGGLAVSGTTSEASLGDDPPLLPVVIAAEIASEKAAADRGGVASGLLLALRYVQARFVSVWGLLIAAALCPPQAFADFAVFSALANFVSIAALLRFEALFYQSGDPDRLGRAFRLACAAGLGFLLAATLVVAATTQATRVPAEVGTLFVITLAARAVMRLISSEATAEGDFRALGNSNIVQAIVQPVVMLLLIWQLGPLSVALLAADAIGHVVGASYLVWRRRASLPKLAGASLWSWADLRDSAARWRAAPTALLPSALLSFGFMVLPLIALPYADDALLAAHVALAMRLLEVPTQMFAAVSVPLVLSNLRAQAPAARQGFVRRAVLLLIGGSVGLFCAIALFALGADALLDRTQWDGVGDTVALMALFYCGVALVTPLQEIGSLSPQPNRQLLTNAAGLLAAALTLYGIGHLSPALLIALGIVSLARMLGHVRFAWTRMGAG